MAVPDLLPVGTQAPDFTLPASDGQLLTLSALRGHKHVVLIFYVGDHTPDCNRQLSSLRDDMPELAGLDILVVGINPAGVEEHARYCTQLGLNFVVDKQGLIRFAARGMHWVPEFYEALSSLP